MLYKDLISKYRSLIQAEHAKYAEMGSTEIPDVIYNEIEYRRILFEYVRLNSYRIECMEDLRNLPLKIIKELKGCGRLYHNLGVVTSFNEIKTSAHILKKDINKFLNYEESKYHFKADFTEVVKMEMGVQYLKEIDCSVIAMYRDGIITFDQLVESTKKC